MRIALPDLIEKGTKKGYQSATNFVSRKVEIEKDAYLNKSAGGLDILF